MNKNLLFSKSLVILSSIVMIIASCQPSQPKNVDDEVETAVSDSLKSVIVDNSELIVGLEPDAPPVYYKEGNAVVGFDYDLLKFISSQVFEDADIKVVEAGYDDLPEMLNSGKIHIMAGGRTSDEDDNIKYSKSYLSFGYCIITRKINASKYNSLSSISKAKIGVYDDAASDWIKEKYQNAKISIIGSREDEETPESDWMQALVDGEVDVIIYDYPFATNEIGDYDGKFSITSKNINGDDLNNYVLGINSNFEGAARLMKEINKAIKSYKESEMYSKAISKYIPNPGNNSDSESIPSGDSYIIIEGETLSIIAREHLGSADRWKEIYELNKQNLASEDIIYPGQRLLKPNGWQ
jgi:ABC-type amino acid transport substrate-binding protein